MDKVSEIIRLSASDLVNHLACRRLTELNHEVEVGLRAAPEHWDPTLDLLWERGLAHEQVYIQHLTNAGAQVTWVEGSGLEAATVAATMKAMKDGKEVIVQGSLVQGHWGGRMDILRRVEMPSSLGGWSYEVIDTKLARETKSGTILQLSLYSDLVGRVQDLLPERMYVVAPWTEFEPQAYRTGDYAAYYRLVKAWLESAVAKGSGGSYPDPKEHCGMCRWSRECDNRRRRDDHLCLVAGISSLQIGELTGREVATTAGLAATPLPLPWKPERGAAVSYEKIREQARVQVGGREEGRTVYETLEPKPDVGLAMLPAPSAGDIFFDFEGDPFVGPGGFEYLFGYLAANERDQPEYTGLWALSSLRKRSVSSRISWTG